jgi:hypothetical protein
MEGYGPYVDEQEDRLREIASKIDLVKTRAGMTEDEEERTEFRDRIRELDSLVNLFTNEVEKLRQAGNKWEDVKEGVEKAYHDVKEGLRRASGGLIK